MWTLLVFLFVSGGLCDDGGGFGAFDDDDDVPKPLINDVPQPIVEDAGVPAHWILVSYADGSPIPGLAESRHKHNQELIINGQNAVNGNHPYQVSLQVQQNGMLYHICGGSLWSASKVITAAHCLDNWGVLPHKAALGYYQLSQGTWNWGSQIINVRWASKHPSYSHGNGFPNDIAVLTLSASAQLTNTVKTIQMSNNLPAAFVGVDAVLTGWGKTKWGQSADILQYTKLRVIDKATCSNYWPNLIFDQTLCCRSPPRGGCQGDSGGPLVYSGFVIGVVSWGSADCDTNKPNMYSSPAYHKNWVVTQW